MGHWKLFPLLFSFSVYCMQPFQWSVCSVSSFPHKKIMLLFFQTYKLWVFVLSNTINNNTTNNNIANAARIRRTFANCKLYIIIIIFGRARVSHCKFDSHIIRIVYCTYVGIGEYAYKRAYVLWILDERAEYGIQCEFRIHFASLVEIRSSRRTQRCVRVFRHSSQR